MVKIIIILVICCILFYVLWEIFEGTTREAENSPEIEREEFKVKSIFGELKDKYIISVEGERETIKKLPQIPKIRFVKDSDEVRLEIIKTTRYMIQKRWFRPDKKWYCYPEIECTLYVGEKQKQNFYDDI